MGNVEEGKHPIHPLSEMLRKNVSNGCLVRAASSRKMPFYEIITSTKLMGEQRGYTTVMRNEG